MFDIRRSLWVTLACVGYIALSGCLTIRKQKLEADSIATCRELSRDGVTAMEMGEWGRAQSKLEEAVDASPTDLDARRQLAEALWQNHSRRDAVVQMEAAVRLDPRHAPTLVRSGEMMLAVGAIEKAQQRSEEAISLDGNLAGAWALRGRVFRQQGEPQRALADMQQALRFSPHLTDLLLEVAQVQYELGRPQRSLTTLHQLLDIYPPGEEPQQVLWLEGLAYGSLERHLDAVESLHAASLRGRPQADLLYQLARAEQEAGNPSAAAGTLQEALALDTGHRASQVMLAELRGLAAPGNSEVIRR